MAEVVHAEDDARRAAGFAMGVEGQVKRMLQEAQRQAHDEVALSSCGYGGARPWPPCRRCCLWSSRLVKRWLEISWVEAAGQGSGQAEGHDWAPFQAGEVAEGAGRGWGHRPTELGTQAIATAATEGLKPWADAMRNAAKVRDAYSTRSYEFAQAKKTQQ